MAHKYALSHDTTYRLLDMWYAGSLADGVGMPCQNCGKIITNMAKVKDEQSGRQYIVGQDCAETLTGIGNTEDWEDRKYSMRQAKRLYDFYQKVKKNESLQVEAVEYAFYITGTLPKKTIKGGQTFEYSKVYTEMLFESYLEMLPKSFKTELESWKKSSTKSPSY